MKKIFLSLLVLIMVTMCLTSCDPSSYYFKKNNYIDLIEKIELVKYTNDNYTIVNPTEVALKFDFSKVEKLETLDESKIDEFLTEYEKIVFHLVNKCVNEPTEYCLLWYLKNGNFIVFSCTIIEGDRAYDMAAEFSENGEFLTHHAHFAAAIHYELILSNFFESYVL